MSDIAAGREELLAVAYGLRDGTIMPDDAADEIEDIITKHLFRQRYASSPGARAVHKMPTPLQVRQLRAFKAIHPHWNDCDIGRKFGVTNNGRVSEVYHGKNNVPVYDVDGNRI